MKPFFFRLLDVSTWHITEDDYGILIAHFARFSDDYSLVIRVDPDDLAEAGVSKECLAVFRWAKEQGADYILFDADGTHYDHLPKFDW